MTWQMLRLCIHGTQFGFASEVLAINEDAHFFMLCCCQLPAP
jgi:hypothetical protein